MSSKITLKNLQDQEFSIVHPDGAGAISIDSNNIATLGNIIGLKNIIINGDMRVNQRAFNGNWDTASAYQYGYDRWFKNGTLKGQAVEDINYKKNTVYTISGTGIATSQLTSPSTGHWTISVPFSATNIQVEEGSISTTFEQRPYGLELSLCQRYYETGRVVATDSKNGYLSQKMMSGIKFFVPKRVVPSITLALIATYPSQSASLAVSDGLSIYGTGVWDTNTSSTAIEYSYSYNASSEF